MNIKKSMAVIAAAILMFPAVALSHPGRTDANGGHYNRSTGEYHYHHGYPQHQHVNGKCPYDFVDKTGQNSGTSGGTSNKPVPTKTPVPAKKNQVSIGTVLLQVPFYIFGAGIIAFPFWLIIKGIIQLVRQIIEDVRKNHGKAPDDQGRKD